MTRRESHSTTLDTTSHNADLDPRTRRAIEEEMDILFLGIGTYVVYSESGRRYEVDVFENSCTCPDGECSTTPDPCKHLRRVDLEIDAGTVPRPDGRIPDSASGTRPPRTTSILDDRLATDGEGDDALVGPIPEFDRYGRSTGATFWRCRTCGEEAIRKCDLERQGCDCHDGPA